MSATRANHPAAGNAEFAPQLAIGRDWRSVPEPTCWREYSRFVPHCSLEHRRSELEAALMGDTSF